MTKSEIDGEIKVKHELKPLKERIQIEEIHKEYVKYFNNEAYQNYEIHDSSFYCLSKQKRKQLLDESKNGELEQKYYKIIKSPFDINKNVTDFFKKGLNKSKWTSANVLSEIYNDRVTIQFVYQYSAQEYLIGRSDNHSRYRIAK